MLELSVCLPKETLLKTEGFPDGELGKGSSLKKSFEKKSVFLHEVDVWQFGYGAFMKKGMFETA